MFLNIKIYLKVISNLTGQDTVVHAAPAESVVSVSVKESSVVIRSLM